VLRPGRLAKIEYVTMRHPQIAVVLLCAGGSPEFLINAMRAGVREVLPSPLNAGELEAAVAASPAKLRGGAARGGASCSPSSPARAAAAPPSSPPASASSWPKPNRCC
jgi:DNA-binding NarL/FixJ family response regulator